MAELIRFHNHTEDLNDYEKKLRNLYQPKYYRMFQEDPRVIALEERQQKEKDELKAKYQRQEKVIEQTLDENKKKGGLYTAGAALCGGMCFSSIFFLGPVCVLLFAILFIVFGFLFRGTEKRTIETNEDKRLDSGLSSTNYHLESDTMWIRHTNELMILISQIAIDRGVIKYPPDNRLGPH